MSPAIDAEREALLKALVDHGVLFVVIGGAGIQSHGRRYDTVDIDLTPDRDEANLQRLADALNELDCRLVTDPANTAAWVPLPPDYFTPRSLLAATVWNLATRHGQLDLTFAPSGFPGGYGELAPRAQRLTVAGTRIAVLVAALADIHRSKRAADRPKDRAYFLAAGEVGAAVMLRRAGYEDVTVFDRGERVGGVWHDNTYPGAACDVPSHLYEFSFAPNPRWSRRYAPQAEIQAYLEDVARREGVLPRIRTSTEVQRASFDDARAKWVLETSAGAHEADLLVTACGQLSVPSVPSLPGLDGFEGPAFHSARWRHDVPIAGKRIAVVGSGCSAIQIVPAIQPSAGHVDVYQRSPGWTVPRLDGPYSERAQRLFERFPLVQRLDRQATFGFMELGALALTSRPRLRAPLRAVGRRQITKAIKDPELRQKVMPADEIGCKRMMLTDEWYPTLTRANVSLVNDPIHEVTPSGIRTDDGTERPADVLVLATGFKTHEFVAPMEVLGTGGRSLSQEWSELARAYLGMSVPGFPNMFLLYGPNTNGGTGSVIYTIEAGVQHVIEAVHALERSRARTIEVRRDAAASFDRELRHALSTSVWHTGCTNWYVDENGNDPNQWPWTWSTYRRRPPSSLPAPTSLTEEPFLADRCATSESIHTQDRAHTAARLSSTSCCLAGRRSSLLQSEAVG